MWWLLAWAALDAAIVVAMWGEPRPVSEAEWDEWRAWCAEREGGK